MSDSKSSTGKVAFSVGFYIVTSITMVMVNKWVLNAVEIPLTFLYGQLLVAVVLLHLGGMFRLLSIPKLDFGKCKALAPLIAVNVIGLSFNTLCLKYVDASFYQVYIPRAFKIFDTRQGGESTSVTDDCWLLFLHSAQEHIGPYHACMRRCMLRICLWRLLRIKRGGEQHRIQHWRHLWSCVLSHHCLTCCGYQEQHEGRG